MELREVAADAVAGHEAVEAVGLEQLTHGPILAAGNRDLGIMIRIPGPTSERSTSFAQVLSDIGMNLWIVGEAIPDAPTMATFELPPVPEILSPLLTLIPMQMLAYQIALIRHLAPETYNRLHSLVP